MADPFALGHHRSHFSTVSLDEIEDVSSTNARGKDPAREVLIHENDRGGSLSRINHALHYWCYGLHVFFILIHVVLVGLLFTHPEHRFSVPVNSTTLTVGLSAFLQAFYTIYTAVLLLMTQQLALSAAVTKRQTLTAVHDIVGAWNGIGAAINSLWQQTKVVSAPWMLVLILAYLASMSGLHIVSSSVIQFEAFNNTVKSVVPSRPAWSQGSANLSSISWGSISPLLSMWPLLTTAKGLSGRTLYDVPSSDYAYTGAIVNATTISAECGLFSNLSVGTWDPTFQLYKVNISGLGGVSLGVSGLLNSVSWIEIYNSTFTYAYCPECFLHVAGYQVSTAIELGNLTGQVLQVDIKQPAGETIHGTPNVNVSITTHFVGCTLDATTTPFYLSMEDGRVTDTQPLSKMSEHQPWALWLPGSTSELTHAFNTAKTIDDSLSVFCQKVQLPGSDVECGYGVSFADVYLNSLWNVSWFSRIAPVPDGFSPQTTLQRNEMQDAVAQTAAAFVWLASAVGSFQQSQGDSLISSQVLELRLNVNTLPVIVGMVTSSILLIIIIWMFHNSHPTYSKGSVIKPGILGLVWISARSKILQHCIKKTSHSLPDQLRISGMKNEVSLADLTSQPMGCDEVKEDNFQDRGTISWHFPAPDWQSFIAQVSSLHWLCYVLHGIFLAFHVVLIALLVYHPEHHVTIPQYNPWVTTTLSIFLQTFYVLYTAGLVFIMQQLAIQNVIKQKQYLTAVHDVAQAWTGVGSALYTLGQQIKIPSSILTLLGVVIYLACISALHIASTTIMQFTTFNSTSLINVQAGQPWPNSSVLANVSWAYDFFSLPPNSLIANIQTNGLLNNTVYDVLDITDSHFTSATVNATSVKVNCGLVSNLSADTSSLNFSLDGFGSGAFFFSDLTPAIHLDPPKKQNQIVHLPAFDYMKDTTISCNSNSACNGSLFFMITTDLDLNKSIQNDAKSFSVNIAEDGKSPVMAYLAACTLLPQTTSAILDVHTGMLTPSPSLPSLRPWTLLSTDLQPQESINLTSIVGIMFYNSGYAICPQDGFVGCSLFNTTTNISLHTITTTPNQVEQAIGQTVASVLWTAGQLGSKQGGFDRKIGESQVIQTVTRWRLNINVVPVVIASSASLILFVLVFFLIGMPSRMPYYSYPSITGLSVLEVLWTAAHSQTLCSHMADVDDPSMDQLRRAGMFKICLGDIKGSETESEALLE